MGFHTFDPGRADRLEDVSRYRYCSREELVAALDPRPEDAVADFGSGTGFYTDEVAPFVGELRAVDVQSEMHDRYRAKGVPANVELVTANVADLPFADGALDGAFSTMTFHEFAGDGAALAEIYRVLAEDARFVVADWTATGNGESGPPTDERYDRDDAVEMLEDAGFETLRADRRPETMFVVARR